MRVFMLSWEYPPKTVGGLARHVYDLTLAMVREGVEIHLFTCGTSGAPDYENVNGVHVYRVTPYQVSAPDFPAWALQFNVAILERIIPVLREIGEPHVIHAHDWLVAFAARALKHSIQKPLIATIHATEFGRNNGLHNATQNYISSIEWWLTYEAWKVIVCSRYMQNELNYIFQLPSDKMRIIHNGVNPDNFVYHPGKLSRNSYAADNERIVFFVGRLVREKGVQVLLDAVPQVLAHHPNTKFVIGGKGPHEDQLRYQARRLGIDNRVYFTGFVNEEVRNALYHWADVAVFPSLYEPFGIVALEAMAARTPVIVADTGGMSEIIDHGVEGLKVYPGDSHSLALNINLMLSRPDFAEKMKEKAYRKVVEQYDWGKIARETKQTYQEVRSEHARSRWPARVERPGRIFGRVYQMFERYS